MVTMPPTIVVAAVPTFADVPAANRNAVMESTTATAADGNSVMEPTATMEATTAMEATAAAMEAAAAAMETTIAVEAATAATMAATASAICRDRQNRRATQHSSKCGEFRHEVQHGCRNSTPTFFPSGGTGRPGKHLKNRRKLASLLTDWYHGLLPPRNSASVRKQSGFDKSGGTGMPCAWSLSHSLVLADPPSLFAQAREPQSGHHLLAEILIEAPHGVIAICLLDFVLYCQQAS